MPTKLFESPRDYQVAAKYFESLKQKDRREGSRFNEREFYADLFEKFRSPGFDRTSVNMRLLFENFVKDGRSFLESSRYRSSGVKLLEAGQAVDTSVFKNIVGQLVFAETLDVLESPDYIGMSLVTDRKANTRYQEIIPGVGRLGNVAQRVGEDQSYPRAGFTEEWIVAPEAHKTGFVVEVTEELAFEDNSGLVMERARAGTEAMAISIEREILSTVLGVTKSYRYNGNAAVDTYSDSTAGHLFDNLLASTTLTNWTSIETAWALFDAITDPNTGEPVNVGNSLSLIVPTALATTAKKILFGDGIAWGNYVTNYDTTAAPKDPAGVMMSPNPLSNNFRGPSPTLVTSLYVKAVTGAADSWFLGNFPKAFSYRTVWPVQTEEMGANSAEHFDRDCIAAFKVRRLGAPMVREPRYVVKVTA